MWNQGHHSLGKLNEKPLENVFPLLFALLLFTFERDLNVSYSVVIIHLRWSEFRWREMWQTTFCEIEMCQRRAAVSNLIQVRGNQFHSNHLFKEWKANIREHMQHLFHVNTKRTPEIPTAFLLRSIWLTFTDMFIFIDLVQIGKIQWNFISRFHFRHLISFFSFTDFHRRHRRCFLNL